VRPGDKATIDLEGLDGLIRALATSGYRVIGPRLRESAIVYDEIDGIADLPIGWTDRQDGGRYRVEPRGDRAVFGYAVGPQSWKRYLHPPRRHLWRVEASDGGFVVQSEERTATSFAFIGVRACELHAIRIQDRVFTGGPAVDTHYRDARERAFVVALNCSVAGGTCFCSSMNTGPKVDGGFDLALTELIEPDRHLFLLEVGSERGSVIAGQLASQAATAEDVGAAQAVVAATARRMGRHLDTDGLKELLQRNLEHPRWDEVATRCLNCTNCTMVCPTCFCTTTEDSTDLAGQSAERVQRWDSCFTIDFSYVHGGSIRQSGKSRYRQWMTHKLSTWWDQFGTTGCVGCGRCITWCPVAIDITEEAHAIRATDGLRAGDGAQP
jgi:ferredoxin